jgi:hypothetical protein
MRYCTASEDRRPTTGLQPAHREAAEFEPHGMCHAFDANRGTTLCRSRIKYAFRGIDFEQAVELSRCAACKQLVSAAA